MRAMGDAAVRYQKRQWIMMALVALVACQEEKCPTDTQCGLGLLDDYGCGGSYGIPKSPTIVITSARGRADADSVVSGDSVQLIATLYDTLGNALPGRSFAWGTEDTLQVSIRATGMVRARRTGWARIHATTNGVDVWGWFSLRILEGAPGRLVVSPADASLPRGGSLALTATVEDSAGNRISGASIVWSSSDSTIASVSASGFVLAKGEGGPVRITATAAGISAFASITVTYAANLATEYVIAGGTHTCALAGAGRAFCWGRNDHGQLGDSTFERRVTPVAVRQGSVRFVALAAGDAHTCGLTALGTVHCWGAAADGALGDGLRAADRPYPGMVEQGTLVFTRLTAGTRHTCALAEAKGEVWCWGANDSGQIGDGSVGGARPVPTRTTPLPEWFATVSAGGDFTCAATAGLDPWCWGANQSNQLGDSTWRNSATPVHIVRAGNRNSGLTAGAQHACALGSDGVVRCWGGQPKDSATTFPSPASQPGDPLRFFAQPGGEGFQCAITQNERAACWGVNSAGQLGDGTTNVAGAGELRYVSLGRGSPTRLTAGRRHACALSSLTEAWCWGDNAYGQLGDGTTTSRASPVLVRMP